MGYLSLSLRSELNSSYMSSALRSVLRVNCRDMKRTSTTKQVTTAAAASMPTMYCHHTVITSPGDYYTGLSSCPGQLEPNTTAGQLVDCKAGLPSGYGGT